MTERITANPESFDTLEAMPLDLPDELLIIANPVSANALRGKRLITDLQQAHPTANIDIFPTSPNGREVNQQRLLDFLEERVNPDSPHRKNLWIVLATGDGTIRDVAEAMQRADKAIRSVPILPIAAGNGNDFSTMVHSLAGKYAPATLLDKARLQPIYPIACDIAYDSQEVERKIGVSYLSFGATAHAAKRIDQDRGHSKITRLVREKAIAVRSVLQTDHFEIEEHGTRQILFERIIANGNRMAKFLHFPGKLEEAGFRDIRIESGAIIPLAINAGRLACGLLKGEAIQGDEQIVFTTKTDTMMQLDGEAFPVRSGAHITIRTAEHPLYVVRLT